MHIDRTAALIRRLAAATSLLVCLVATAVYLRHREAPGSKELWELALLVAAEIAVVTTGLTLVAQSMAQRVGRAGAAPAAARYPSPLRSL